jgi:hypothetical protein
MNLTISIDKSVVARAEKKAQTMGKSLNQLVSDYLRTFADDDPEKSIAEFMRLSGRGNSSGWRFDRAGIHNRKS